MSESFSVKPVFIALVLNLILVALVASSPAPPIVPSAAGHPLTAEDAEAWLDGLMPTALRTAQVPGAVVVIVKDGKVLLEKGYGFSDYEKATPVDARTTLFRVGSTSKLFTWTAVMQLVEQGKLDLDADVNTYLDFKIPSYHGKPVTLRQIMTHRAGFEESAKDLLSFGVTAPVLGERLKSYVPPRILDPGEGPGYSNYAAALAGYIVQRLSGEPYDDYIQRHILMPLDMQNSTFKQPLPEAMRAHMSTGYETWDKPGAGFEVVAVPPAGALTASGDDMAHFMLAHLQLGRYGDAEILKPETARLMQTTITKALPDLNGNALGFYEQNINGHRVIAHGGDTVYFHTDLALFADDQVGLFTSVNAKGKDAGGAFLRQSVFEEFADRYFPGAPTVPRVDEATAKAHAAMIAGSYINTRRADSTFISLLKLIGTTTVSANADGTITTAPAGATETFFEIKPFLWQQQNGHDRIQGMAKDGKVVRWSSDSAAPAYVFERPGGIAGTGLELPLAAAALVLLSLTAILWPVGALIRRHYKKGGASTAPGVLAFRWVRIGAVLSIAAIGMWVFVITEVSDPNGNSVVALVHLAQIVSLLAFAGGFAMALWYLSRVLKDGGWIARLYAIALTAAFSVMLWISLGYHLIGFSGEY
jgi:CubicO group peptidase (beta-lactamase class C family)